MAQTVKRLPTMWETWVQSLGWEDRLEKEMETHSSILAWKIPWMEEPGRVQSVHGIAKSRTRLSDFTFTFMNANGLPKWLSGKEPACQFRRHKFSPWSGRSPERGNGNPLQYSCLGNPRDRGARWATVHRVIKSQKQLSN